MVCDPTACGAGLVQSALFRLSLECVLLYEQLVDRGGLLHCKPKIKHAISTGNFMN